MSEPGGGDRVGGLGSGRRRTRLGVDECRALDVGELCDQGRWRTHPRGEVLWRERNGGETRARLAYVITGQESAADELLLTYRYGREGAGLSCEHEVELECPSRRAQLRLLSRLRPPGAHALRAHGRRPLRLPLLLPPRLPGLARW
jgi:hypothetical protein